MIFQIIVCVGIGLAGLLYVILYERVVMIPVLRQKGAKGIVRQRIRWLKGRDALFGATFPGVEEAVVRGLPMLFVHNPLYLAIVLAVVNIGFTAAHADRKIIGNSRWLLRYARGLVYSVPAMFGSLYICLILHSAWNIAGAIKYRNHDPRDRIYIWTGGPLEILIKPEAAPSVAYAKLFRRFRTVRAST